MGITAFISYSRVDRKHVERLTAHLSLLQRQGILETWHDNRLEPGTEWTRAIEEKLIASNLIILMISADFLASDYCYNIEMQHALARHETRKARLIPIVVGPCDWKSSPLARLEVLPKQGRPVNRHTSIEQVWLDIAVEVRLICEQILNKSAAVGANVARQPETEQSSTGDVKMRLTDVFCKSGIPTVTFIEPKKFYGLKLSLAQPGRGVVIEGPTGIGKTTALRKALTAVSSKTDGFTKEFTPLSARNKSDLLKIESLTEWHTGTVAIDDFHRLDRNVRLELIDYFKHLADAEPPGKKLVIVGIPECGLSIVRDAFDVATRMDVFALGKVDDQHVLSMIEKGEAALNIKFAQKEQIQKAAAGSLNVAQFLCYTICELAELECTSQSMTTIEVDFQTAMSNVLAALSRKFAEPVKRLAWSGTGADPVWLGILDDLCFNDGYLSFASLLERRPEYRAAIIQFKEERRLDALAIPCPSIANCFYWDEINDSLLIDDPQLTFYLQWWLSTDGKFPKPE